MKHLAPFFPKMKAPWTADAPLPGGENFDYAALKNQLVAAFPFITESVIERWLRSYGSRTTQLWQV